MSQEINVQVSGKTVRLDDQYVYEAKLLYNEAASLVKAAQEAPVISDEQVEADMDEAAAAKHYHGVGAIITFSLFFALGLASLALPLEPFLSRAPICGVFVGIGGIILFSYLLRSDKRAEKKETYQNILASYGVDDIDDIPAAADERKEKDRKSREAFEKLLTFIRYANPAAETPADCELTITTLERLLKQGV